MPGALAGMRGHWLHGLRLHQAARLRIPAAALEVHAGQPPVDEGGSRLELEKRFNEFKRQTLAEAGMSSEEEDEDISPGDDIAHPAIVMLDHAHGTRDMRVVDQKGIGDNK